MENNVMKLACRGRFTNPTGAVVLQLLWLVMGRCIIYYQANDVFVSSIDIIKKKTLEYVWPAWWRMVLTSSLKDILANGGACWFRNIILLVYFASTSSIVLLFLWCSSIFSCRGAPCGRIHPSTESLPPYLFMSPSSNAIITAFELLCCVRAYLSNHQQVEL